MNLPTAYRYLSAQSYQGLGYLWAVLEYFESGDESTHILQRVCQGERICPRLRPRRDS